MERCKWYNEEKRVVYPLCNGAKDKEQFKECDCDNCCLYKDMAGEGGYEEYGS